MTSDRGAWWLPGERARCCVAPVLLALHLAGCTVAPQAEDGSREYLDETTAATVTVRGRPLVFARERPELAVHARDYLTLLPVDVNRSGRHAQYFFGYLWSTIDKRAAGEDREAAPRFELVADGRRIALVPLPGEPRSAGLGEAPLEPPAASAVALVAATSREEQEFLRGAAEIVAVAHGDGVAEPFALWRR